MKSIQIDFGIGIRISIIVGSQVFCQMVHLFCPVSQYFHVNGNGILLVIITIPILVHVVVILYTVLDLLGSIVIAVLTFLLVAIWSVVIIIILVTIIIILPSTVAPFVPAGITILPAIIPTANGLGIPSIATLPLVS